MFIWKRPIENLWKGKASSNKDRKGDWGNIQYVTFKIGPVINLLYQLSHMVTSSF